MKKRYIIIPAVAIVSAITALLAFSTVPTPKEEDCLVLKGVVTEIREGGDNDAIFKLHNDKRLFYINRGLEKLPLDVLRKELTGQEVTIKYPDYFALLNYDGSIRHISKLEHNGKIVYTEID